MASNETAFRIQPMGDAALVLRFGEEISAEVNARVHAAAAVVAAARLPGVAEVVPGYATLTLMLDEDSSLPDRALERRLRALLHAQARGETAALPRVRQVTLPVCYGGREGQDLIEFAAKVKLDPEEVVRRHAAAEYQVAMLGFQPGFPYLLGLDPALALPRRATPRPSVPAGSVAIGGAQTGIYPTDSPGGWHLIGRTRARLFDPLREPATLLAPGDRVRFRAVSAAQLEEAQVEVVK